MPIDHIDDSDDASSAAVSYTNDFLRSAVEAIDETFGEGFARENPALVGQYMMASATNLGAFMQATMTMASSAPGGLGDLLAAMEDDDMPGGFNLDALMSPEPVPTKKPRKKR